MSEKKKKDMEQPEQTAPETAQETPAEETPEVPEVEETLTVSREQMERFLYQLTYGLIRGVVEEQSRGTAISEEDKSFIAEFYKYSFVGVMLDWIRQGMTADPRALTEKISAAMRGSIANAIRNFSETE